MAEWISIGASPGGPTMMPTVNPQTHNIVGLDIDYGMGHQHSSTPSTLSVRQEKVLSVLFVLSAALSIMGSATIISKVLRNRSIASPYDRLMFGLSSSDIIASLTCAMQPFLLNADTSRRIWAVGNDATCAFLGFLTQLSFAAMIYNGVLSYYYLLTVRFGWKREQIARYERLMHFSAIIFPLATASIGAAFGVFHELEVGFGCWTSNYPEGCEGDECTAHIWGYVFGMIPIGFSFGSLLINNIIIYRYVRKHLCPACCEDNQTGSPAKDGKQRTLDMVRRAQVREVAIQGFLYVGTFFFSYWSPLALRLMEHLITDLDDAKVFPLLVIQSICWPLQGFFNMFVYVRPSYLRVRASYPDLSLWEAMRRACFETKNPGPADSTPWGDTDPRTKTADDRSEADNGIESSSPAQPKKSFFQMQPREFYSACARSVMSAASGRSTQSLGFSTTLEVVEEEGAEEFPDDVNDSGTLPASYQMDEVQEPEHPIANEDSKEAEDGGLRINDENATVAAAAAIVHSVDDSALSSIASSRSFRIRMDGVVRNDSNEEKDPIC